MATAPETSPLRELTVRGVILGAIITVLFTAANVYLGLKLGLPCWLSTAVIAVGGILGVMSSVPLRRALVTGSDLPYPEGVAAAEVLKVGAGVGGAEENRRGLAIIIWGSLVSAAYAALAQT